MESNSSWREEFMQEQAARRWLKPLTAAPASSRTAKGGCDDQEREWSEEDLVLLHWKLLERIRLLQDAHAPLEEKIEILHWMFTDQYHDGQPFSFASCLRVVGCSPLSPAPCFVGAVNVEEIRDWIRRRLKQWFEQSLQVYPSWVRDVIVEQPGWIAGQLERNPQWLNEQIRRNRVEGDLFA